MADQIVEVDPLDIYFTFSRIRPQFSCGRTIESTYQQFVEGSLTPRDLPLLSVLQDAQGNYYSQNNRRLYTYKKLREEGRLATVPVRLRPLPQTKRMHAKYTPQLCSKTATLMGERRKEGKANADAHEENERGDSGNEDSEEKEEDMQHEKRHVASPATDVEPKQERVPEGKEKGKKKKAAKSAPARREASDSDDEGSGGCAGSIEAELRKLGLS